MTSSNPTKVGGFKKWKKTKILNLYAGIGGNRKLWKNVQVTAVENNPEIAEVYKKIISEKIM